jgi:hypothetical protein
MTPRRRAASIVSPALLALLLVMAAAAQPAAPPAPAQGAWSLLGTWNIRIVSRVGTWTGTIDILKGSGETGVYDARAQLRDQSRAPPVTQAYRVSATNPARTAYRFDGYNVTGDPQYCPDAYHMTLGPDGRAMQGTLEDRCGNRGTVTMTFAR